MCRSPWSNKYDPPLDDGTVPSGRLRKLEVDANQAFDTYREMYFESGICSVYVWDLDHGFAIVVLIKKGESLGMGGEEGREGGRGGRERGWEGRIGMGGEEEGREGWGVGREGRVWRG